MREEAFVKLESYLDRAPNPSKDRVRYEWHAERYRFAARQVNRVVHIADIGCGWGFGVEILAEYGHPVTGYDVNPHIVEYARSQCQQKAKYEVYDIIEGPLPDRPFGLICAFEVVEHLEDPVQALINIKSSLKDDGIVVISTPCVKTKNIGSHPYHCSEFTQSSFCEMMSKYFSEVSYYSQGVDSLSREYQSRRVNSPIKGVLDRLDIFNIKKHIPDSIKRRVMDRLVGISSAEGMSEVIAIRSGVSDYARWILAVCCK